LINFAASEWNAISHREVNGRFALASDFVAPPQHGMQDLPPSAKHPSRKLFSLRTSICPTLDEDEQTRLWTVVDVAEEIGAVEPPKESQPSLEQWLDDLGLGSIRVDHRFAGVALKQFRDAQLADRACYQGLVQVERKFTSKPEIEWIAEHLKATIYKFDTMQIVKKFGLVGGTPYVDRHGRQGDVFVPEKPFWVRGDMEQGLGVNLCWRAGAMGWQRDQ
jgi:hypothetical protein